MVDVRQTCAGRLGGIHRQVGTTHQIHPVVGVVGRHSNPGGETDVQTHQVPELERITQRVAEVVCDR